MSLKYEHMYKYGQGAVTSLIQIFDCESNALITCLQVFKVLIVDCQPVAEQVVEARGACDLVIESLKAGVWGCRYQIGVLQP